MSTTLPAPAARQAAVVAAIAVLHVGAFLAVALGPGVQIRLPSLSSGPITILPPPFVPTVALQPDPVTPGDYQPEQVTEPVVDITVAENGEREASGWQSAGHVGAGANPALPVPEFRGPRLQTRDARLQALVDSCYPAAARRRGQEGRGVARVVVDAAGRASGWSIEQTTGFAELDPGMGCVSRRVQFEPGRRDGRAIEATVLMPIFFQLH